METTEWALILFTVLGQTAIGACLLVTWFRQWDKEGTMEGAYRKSVWVLAGLAFIGLAASLLHLGRPLMAITALRHLSTSWLSREIFFTGGFFVLLVASVLLDKRVALRRVIDWLAVLAGVLAVVSMAASYSMTMRPAWQGFHTYVAFGCTALFLGSATAGGLLALFGRGQERVARNLQDLIWVAVVALVVQLAAVPFYISALGAGLPAAKATADLLAGEYLITMVVRWALPLAGGLIPLLVMWRRLGTGKVSTGLVYTALAFILAGELVGRYVFYAASVPMGIG